MPLSSVLHFVCQTQVPAFRSFLLFLTISLLFIQFFANSTLLSLQVLKIPSFSFQELVHDKETILMSIAMSSLDYLASGQFLLRPAASSTLHFSAWGCLSPSEVLQSSFFIPSLYPILVCPGFFSTVLVAMGSQCQLNRAAPVYNPVLKTSQELKRKLFY